MKKNINEISEKLGAIESILQDWVMVHDTRDLEDALKSLENTILAAALVVAKPKNPQLEIANMYVAVEKFRSKSNSNECSRQDIFKIIDSGVKSKRTVHKRK